MNNTSSSKKTAITSLPEGRTRNAEATRKGILEAARKHFIKDGYDNAGLRAIAGGAGVDAALISRYFGSKKNLFLAVLQSMEEDSIRAFIGERSTCGQRLATAMLNPARKTANSLNFISLVTSSSSSPEASKLLQKHMEKRFMLPFAEWLGGPRSVENAWLIGSMLMGAAIMHNIRPERDSNVERMAALLQYVIDTSDAELAPKPAKALRSASL